eukprot:s53_g7.t1
MRDMRVSTGSNTFSIDPSLSHHSTQSQRAQPLHPPGCVKDSKSRESVDDLLAPANLAICAIPDILPSVRYGRYFYQDSNSVGAGLAHEKG